MRIRSANADEAVELTELAIRSKAYWGYAKEFMEACEAELEVTEEKILDKRFVYCVAELESQIAGFYCLRRNDRTPFELDALFVLPEAIGKGAGKALFEHASKTAYEMGSEQLLIESDPNAAGFYAAHGAELIGQTPSGSIPGRKLPLYRIELKK